MALPTEDGDIIVLEWPVILHVTSPGSSPVTISKGTQLMALDRVDITERGASLAVRLPGGTEGWVDPGEIWLEPDYDA